MLHRSSISSLFFLSVSASALVACLSERVSPNDAFVPAVLEGRVEALSVDASAVEADAAEADAAEADVVTVDAAAVTDAAAGDATDASVSVGLAPYTPEEAIALIEERCAHCHGEDFLATSIDVPSDQSPSMVLVKPGSRAASYLFHKLAGTQEEVGGSGGRMPKGGPRFTDEELERFGRYLDTL